MPTLEFCVEGQFIKRIDKNTPVAKNRNYFNAHFDFLTDEWQGIKTALFILGNYKKSQIIDENGDCEVPWEFFDTDHSAIGKVSVYCGDLVTANYACVSITKSGYVKSDASTPPTPDVYQQIIEKLDDISKQKIEEIDGGTFSDWRE